MPEEMRNETALGTAKGFALRPTDSGKDIPGGIAEITKRRLSEISH